MSTSGPLRVLPAVATVAILGTLLLASIVGIAPNVDTRLVELGEGIWPGYASELKTDPEPPDCNVEEVRSRLDNCAEAPAPSADDEDPFAEDPFAEEPDEDPFAEEADPFGEEADPFGEAAAPATNAVSCDAVRNLLSTCEERWAAYGGASERLSPMVRVYRSVEQRVSNVAEFPYMKHLLVLLVLLGAAVTTLERVHISLRHPGALVEHRLAQGGQLVAHLFWMASCMADFQVQLNSSAESENLGLPVLWAVGFLVLASINVLHLVRPPADLSNDATTVGRALMVLPLYVYMAIIGGIYFLAVEQHPSGQAIYLHKFVQHPNIYLGIGLYIWAGMMLSRTRLAQLGFDVLLPFGLPPALLAWLVVVLAALPTAYSGASGIFVIAAGAVIFERLSAAGASPRMALAATAMSGSLGVVLRPCLVVVLISVLNKQVTTDQLFGWGFVVFGLTVVLSLIAFLLWNREPLRLPDFGTALPSAFSALRPLVPYLLVAIAVLLFYAGAFKTFMNERSAPMVLPAVLLALLVWDRRAVGEVDLWPRLRGATEETSHHTGALLMVMCGSVGLGGVVERAEVLALVPESFGSLWLTMTILVVVMVLVGMTMDALGAVVLVSVTVAKVAYDNGIDPTHFWMVVLVGFELGYLTPPVSLNHLLARQVIGEASEVEVVDPKDTWFEEYSHLLVPMGVMGTALVLVAYVPLLFY